MFGLKSEKPCHEGSVKLFKDPQTGIWVSGGGVQRGVEIGFGDLAIALVPDSTGFEIQTEGFEAKFIKPRPRIYIPWADFDIPNLFAEDWKNVVKEVRRLKKNTVVYCMGGHGRTGTALAILAVLMGVKTKNPVEYVRTNYCKEAIETEEQIKYIEYVTGCDLKDEIKKYRKKEKSNIYTQGVDISRGGAYGYEV